MRRCESYVRIDCGARVVVAWRGRGGRLGAHSEEQPPSRRRGARPLAARAGSQRRRARSPLGRPPPVVPNAPSTRIDSEPGKRRARAPTSRQTDRGLERCGRVFVRGPPAAARLCKALPDQSDWPGHACRGIFRRYWARGGRGWAAVLKDGSVKERRRGRESKRATPLAHPAPHSSNPVGLGPRSMRAVGRAVRTCQPAAAAGGAARAFKGKTGRAAEERSSSCVARL